MERMAIGGLLAAAVCSSGAAWGQIEVDRCRAMRETLDKLSTPLTLEAEGIRLGDFMEWFGVATQLELSVAWVDDRGSIDGLDPETLVDASFREAAAMDVLQVTLDRATRDSFLGDEATWQLTPYGGVQVAPKGILNRARRVEVYEIGDLVYSVPDYDDAPTLDLNTALQSGQGGGGQSPFQDAGDQDPERVPYEERVDNLIDILQTNVEPEQWEDNGGDGAFLRVWKTGLLVNAPDYIHRQINGYRCRGR